MDNEVYNNIKSNNRSSNKEKELYRNHSELNRIKKRGNFILRQELKNLTIECSIKCSIICNTLMFFVFIIFAIPIIISSNSSIQISLDYTDW